MKSKTASRRKAPAKPAVKSGSTSTTDAYLAGLNEEQRAALEQVRGIIRAAVPEAEECISYGLPAFRLESPLAAFGASKQHCAFYPMSGSIIAAHQAELEGFETSKGTIRFTPDHPLPAALIRKLLKARIAEMRGTSGKER